MLFQILLNIITFFIRFVVWVAFAFLLIPYGIYMFLFDQYPSFVLEYGFGFWSVFVILTIIAYVILWKPILWIVGIVQGLSVGV